MPDKNNSEKVQENSQAVQSHLTILQSVIQRMATNSTSCKAWCITLVSAILVVVADKGKPNFALLALLPTLLFLFLDTYYLALEKGFRKSYNNFVTDLHRSKVDQFDLFEISPDGGHICNFLRAIKSPSVWPFYATLTAMVLMTQKFILA